MCMICALRNPNSATAALDLHVNDANRSAITGDGILSGQGLVIEGADAAESTATAYRFEVGQSVSGQLSSSTDEDWFAIELQAGVTYSIRLLGYGSDFLTDPLVRILNGNGSQLATNDDGFTSGSNTHERDAALTFTATQSGTFFIEADAYGSQTGEYLLSVTESNANGYDFTVDEIAWQLINNGQAFFGTPEAAAFDVGGDGALTVNISGLSEQGQALANAALDVWSAYTGITFNRVTSGTAEITFYDNDPDTTAYAQTFTNGTTIERSEVMVSASWLDNFGTSLESYSFETYLHEIGHALGLAHGGNYNGSADYGTDNFYVNDSLAWSIMSYMQADNDEYDFGNARDWNTHVNASFRYMYGPMIADMIAIQTLYGTPGTAFGGDTTYGFNANTGVAAIDAAVQSGALMAMTVYDTGGTDTLDFSQTSANQVITLAQESLSSVLGGRHNLGIARGATVENAISGSGNDKLLGNSAANVLDAGGGHDTIYGGLGGDTIYGGSGDDVYILDEGATGFSLHDTAGWDELQSYASVDLGSSSMAGIDSIRLLGSGNHNITANDDANYMVGNSGANVLDAGGGNDSLYGGLGADTLHGGDGRDILDAGSQNDRLEGGLSNDSLYGGAGNDTLGGGAGADLLHGGDGRDVFVFTSMADLSTDPAQPDVIDGFRSGVDKIDLSQIDASSLDAGNNAFTFLRNAAFSTDDGGEIYARKFNNPGKVNDYTMIYLDVDGDNIADGFIKLTGLHNLKASDFIL